MKRRVYAICVATAVALGSACADPGPDREAVQTYYTEIAPDVLREYLLLRTRLADVAYGLRVRGRSHCATLVEPVAGIIVGSPESFEDPVIQWWAARTFGIRDAVTVIHVIPDSSFDAAGFEAGDSILAVGGREIGSLDDFRRALAEAESGRLTVVAQRGDRRFETSASLEDGCVFAVAFARSHSLLPAQLTDWEIVAPAGLLRTTTEDELAIAVAHQMGHAVIQLADPPVEPDRVEGLADRIGLQMAADAGYDVSGAAGFWERIAAEHPWAITPAGDDGSDPRPHQDIAGQIADIGELARLLSRPSTAALAE